MIEWKSVDVTPEMVYDPSYGVVTCKVIVCTDYKGVHVCIASVYGDEPDVVCWVTDDCCAHDISEKVTHWAYINLPE